MSELRTGAHTTDEHSGDDPSKAQQVAGQTKQATGQAVSEVKNTATEQAHRVSTEAKTQVRNVAGDVRDKLGEQARAQNDRLVGMIRQTADHLDEMRGDRADSPAATVVSRVADGGRQLADYLDRNGPEGVLREVQDFARRRPGAFLATALAAGFIVGQLGKGVAKADPDAGTKPAADAFTTHYPSTTTGETTLHRPGTPSDAGYASTTPPAVAGDYRGTEYASTGTGTPLEVEDDYTVTGRERQP